MDIDFDHKNGSNLYNYFSQRDLRPNLFSTISRLSRFSYKLKIASSKKRLFVSISKMIESVFFKFEYKASNVFDSNEE